MTKAVLIPDTLTSSIRVVEYSSLEDLQGFVGGPIQIVPLPGPVDGYVNEQGKLSEHRLNKRATEFVRKYLFHGDYVAGPMLIVGLEDKDGEAQDVPENYVIKLFEKLKESAA